MTMSGKILILSSTPPGYSGGGGAIVQSLIEKYVPEKFCYYCPRKIWKNENYKIPESLKKMHVKFGPLRILYLKKRRHKFIILLEEIILFVLLIKRKREIVRFAEDNNVKLIWAILRGDALFLVNYIQKNLKVNLVASVHDPVESEFKDRKILYWFKKRYFYEAIIKSKCLATIGEAMSEYYYVKFNKESIIQRKGVKIIHKQLMVQNEPFVDNIIKIAFAGSIYTSKTFESFLDAIIQFLNSYKEYSIVFNIFSNDRLNNISSHDRLKINIYPWEEEEKVIKIISEMDIGYLPYKFSKKEKIQMQLSFPTKISTYLAAGTPIFFHGPSYSSVNYFFKKFPCGVSCDSLQSVEIVNSLKSLLFDKEKYCQYKKYCKIALEKEFDEQTIFKDFKYFINQGLM